MRTDRAPTADTLSVCEKHGEHTGEICLQCYAVQQERVERESPPLRLENTTEKLRARVLEKLATRNGHH